MSSKLIHLEVSERLLAYIETVARRRGVSNDVAVLQLIMGGIMLEHADAEGDQQIILLKDDSDELQVLTWGDIEHLQTFLPTRPPS